jgi:hypothetical protein
MPHFAVKVGNKRKIDSMGSIISTEPSKEGRQTRKVSSHALKCNTESILGMKEVDLVKMSRTARTDMFILGKISSASCNHLGDDGEVFVNCKTGQQTPFGSFEVVKVSELERRVKAMSAANPDTTQKSCPALEVACNVDIAILQGTLTNDDKAMVQVASNFNCLENGSMSQGPDCGFLVDSACNDCTQGPAAVFGTLSAYLYRVHFFAPKNENEGGLPKDTGTSPINCLQYVSDFFGTPRNGKLLLQGDEKPLTDDIMDDVVGNICVGLHKNCPVMFWRNVRRCQVQQTRDQNVTTSGTPRDYPMVDHVLTASLHYNRCGTISKECLDSISKIPRQHGKNLKKDTTGTYLDRMARALLRASYEATYLSAILQGNKTLLLTLVGGGSFENPIHIIVDEMKRAHEKWANHPASRLEKCQVCLFDSDQTVVELFK